MAKRELINGRKYSFFIDHDRKQLRRYPEDWIDWLRQRILFILVDPIEELLFVEENRRRFDNENFTILLGIVTIICCGIEALGAFYKGEVIWRSGGKHFKDFVIDYMHSSYKEDRNKVEVLYKSFRCGLAHGFCIEKGGFSHGPTYFVDDKDLGLLISIDELFKDFKQACLKYIDKLKKSDQNDVIYRKFYKRFNNIFIKGK